MSIIVQHPGAQSTVQDLGRPGHASIGVSHSGAADELSLRIGNRLLGHGDNCAAVECTLSGGTFVFQHETRCVLAGAECRGVLHTRGGSAESVEAWRVLTACAHDRLFVGPLFRGARVYLCVSGGVQTPRVLGSRSTQVSTSGGGVGGLPCRERGCSCGAPLAALDELPIDAASARSTRICSSSLRGLILDAIARRTLRITAGPQAHLLTMSQRAALSAMEWTVSDRMSRAGVRLVGAGTSWTCTPGMLSQPVAHGMIQAAPSGELIILGPDAPPTGGYPVIASVASVDLPTLGQLRPRDAIRLEWTTIDIARSLHRQRRAELDALLPPA